MTLAEKILYIRKKRGMSQTDLADKLKTTKQTIHKYEHGIVTNLPLNRISELADALDVPAGFFLDWTDEYGNPLTDAKEKQPRQTPELSEDEQLLIRLFRTVPEEDRALVLQMIRAALSSKGLL